MKKLFFIFTSFLFLLQVKSQVKYSTEAKRFIDYDTTSLAFIHALLIDGTGSTAKQDQTVIVRNGKIAWVGDDKKATIPKDAQVLDLTGKTLMPGFIMLHEHMYMRVPGADYFFVKQMPISFPRLYLACGATTIKTAASHEPYFDLGIKRETDSGQFAGPAMFLTAPYIEGREGPVLQMHRITTEKAAIQHVNYWGDQGFYSYKAYQNISKRVLKAAIDAAHKRGQKISGHLCSITYREAAELGIDHLEHGFITCNDFVKAKKENECPTLLERSNSIAALDLKSDSVTSLIQLLASKKIGITSTLAVYEGIVTKQPAPTTEFLEILSPEHRENYLKSYKQIIAAKNPTAIAIDEAFPVAARMEKLFSNAGGLLTVGTDPTGNGGIVAGFSNWRAIELLVEASGFTPLEAIRIATLNGAVDLGIDRITGTIAAGKRADLIVIEGDPSKNISDIRKVVWVFKEGVGFNSKRMFESVKGKVGYY